jgi:hypothetical protein
MQPPAPPEPQGPPPPIEPPEPAAANITSLTEMGFPEPLARKALIMTKDNVEAALEWILVHEGDPDAAQPPTQEELQRVRRAVLRCAVGVPGMAALTGAVPAQPLSAPSAPATPHAAPARGIAGAVGACREGPRRRSRHEAAGRSAGTAGTGAAPALLPSPGCRCTAGRAPLTASRQRT